MAFWGGIPTNNRSIEDQLMRRFVCNQVLQSDSVTKRIEDCGMQNILSSYKKVKGSVGAQICASESLYHPLGSLTQESFDKEDCDDIALLFSTTEFSNCSVKCLRLHRKFNALTNRGKILGSLSSRRIKCSNVFAHCQHEGSLRACQIQYFCEVQLNVVNEKEERKIVSRLVAAVSWYQRHPEEAWLSSPALVFCKFFEPWHSFILVKDIQCAAATCVKSIKFTYGEESVL